MPCAVVFTPLMHTLAMRDLTYGPGLNSFMHWPLMGNNASCYFNLDGQDGSVGGFLKCTRKTLGTYGKQDLVESNKKEEQGEDQTEAMVRSVRRLETILGLTFPLAFRVFTFTWLLVFAS